MEISGQAAGSKHPNPKAPKETLNKSAASAAFAESARVLFKIQKITGTGPDEIYREE